MHTEPRIGKGLNFESLDTPPMIRHPPVSLPDGAVFMVDTNEMAGNHLGYRLKPREISSLAVGDYSIRTPEGDSLEGFTAVERKSFHNLVNEISDRQRWGKCLDRLAQVTRPLVVIEIDWRRITRGNYKFGKFRSRASPAAVAGSCIAWCQRFRIPFWWAGSRHEAETVTQWWLIRSLRDFLDADEAQDLDPAER